MSDILVLYAGGTVGCAGQPLAPMSGERFRAALKARDLLPARCSLQAMPRPLDSASMQPADWLDIAGYLLDVWADYDGFVVLHGTDTLAWTASALSFLLPGIDKPVVLTGAQLPLEEPNSDAPGNIVDAITAASTPRLCEVAVCFASQILRGNRCVKRSADDFAAFASPRWPALGKLAGDHARLDLSTLLPFVEPSRRLSANLDRCSEDLQTIREGIEHERVLGISLHPGFPPELLEAALSLPTAPRGWVLACYGSGNVPEQEDFISVLQKAREQAVCIVAVTQTEHGSVRVGRYQSSAALLEAGVIGGGDLTLPAAQTKLLLLLAAGLSEDELRLSMQQPLAGEMSGN